MTKVLLAGDSLALGLTAPLMAEAQRYGIELKGDGRTSTTAQQWVTGGWLASDVASFDPNVTILSLGTNDATGDLAHFSANVQTLADQATSKGGLLLWLAPPYFAPTLKQFPAGNVAKMRQILLDTLTPRGVNIFPTDADAPAKDYGRAADGVHMSAEGYKSWAKDIAEFAAFAAAAVKGKPFVAAKPGWSTGKKIVVGGGLAALVLAGVVYVSRD
jgi:lysophospholipase L1-like esterase